MSTGLSGKALALCYATTCCEPPLSPPALTIHRAGLRLEIIAIILVIENSPACAAVVVVNVGIGVGSHIFVVIVIVLAVRSIVHFCITRVRCRSLRVGRDSQLWSSARVGRRRARRLLLTGSLRARVLALPLSPGSCALPLPFALLADSGTAAPRVEVLGESTEDEAAALARRFAAGRDC